MAAGFPRVTKPRDEGRSCNTSHDLGLEVTFHHFHKILLVTRVNFIRIQSCCESQEKRILGGHLRGWRPQRSQRGERKIWRIQSPGDQKSLAESSPAWNRVWVQSLTRLPRPVFHSLPHFWPHLSPTISAFQTCWVLINSLKAT